MKLRLIDANGAVSSEQDFALVLGQTPTNPVNPIANDLTSYFYVPQSPNDVSSYLTNSSYANGGIVDVQVILDMPLKLNSGYHEPGEYTNHVRWTDPNGVEYIGAFTMTIPPSSNPGSCPGRTRVC